MLPVVALAEGYVLPEMLAEEYAVPETLAEAPGCRLMKFAQPIRVLLARWTTKDRLPK